MGSRATYSIDTMSLPSEALGMGKATAEYRSRQARPWILATILSVLGLGVIAFGGLSILDGDDGGWIGALFGLLLLAGAVWQIVVAIRNRDLRVVVLEQGVVRTGGGKREVLRWDDITSVFQAITVHYANGIKTGTTHVYTIFAQGGQKVVFNDTLKNVEALGASIQKEATNRLMPRYVQAYNSGGTVTFGKLTLSKAGISNGKDTIPWAQVQAVNINRGQINVRKEGKWLNWAGQSAAATPNLLIFLNLVDQITGINTKKK
jgi:hypothetical protein